MQAAREQFFHYLARKNLRLTSQRAVIFDVFWNARGHISTEELYRQTREKDSSIGQATVYRTLKLLSEAGIAGEVDFGDGVTRYELYFGQAHHDHLICQQCGSSVEVVDEKIERIQEDLARRHGFTLTGHSMYLYGYCEQCSRKRTKAR